METTYILKVSEDGRVEREPFDAADALGQLQMAVGGYIERVPVHILDAVDVFVNEEGRLDGLPGNGVLTRFVYHKSMDWHDLVGNGVIVAHDEEGETVGLAEALCDELEACLGRCGATVAGKEARNDQVREA